MNNDNVPIDWALLDPELRELAPMIKSQLEASLGISGFNAQTLPRIRQLTTSDGALPETEPLVERRVIPGPPGAPDVRVFVVGAKPGASRAAILRMHGGGFIMGSDFNALPRLQQIARDNDCVVVSVEYRLAPETPFPGALEDNYAALRWLSESAATLGVDRARISVMGESAGAGHAAMLAIAARDRGEFPLRHQLLMYPMLDDRTGSTRPTQPWIGRHIWTAEDNQFGWSSLLGMPAGSAAVPYGSVPARVENLQGLPATFIAVGSLDLFVDESIAYAQRLLDAGVPTDLLVVAGAFHGFDGLAPMTAIAQRFTAAVDAAIRRACA